MMDDGVASATHDRPSTRRMQQKISTQT